MVSNDLPEPIVAPLLELARGLSEWAQAHPDRPLAELEQVVLDSWRRVAPAVLAGLVGQTQRGLAERWRRVPARCPGCGGKGQVQSWRRRQVTTLCGQLEWERPRLVCQDCRQGYYPVDATLGIRSYQQWSAGLRELVVRFGSACTFGEASRLLARATGMHVAKESLREATEAAGRAVRAAEDAAVATTMREQRPPGPIEPAPGELVAEADGVFVRYLDDWHEVKVGLVGGWTGSGRADDDDVKLRQASYRAKREEAALFGLRWGAEAARRGAWTVIGWKGRGNSLAELRPVVVLGDGAHWIWEVARDQFGERTEIVDFYHASEHLWKVAHAAYPDDVVAAKAWARARKGELLKKSAGEDADAGPDAVLAALSALSATGAMTESAKEVLREERGYFTNNRERMRYAEFREAGLPIGSGAVESSAKHLVQARMKRAGMRWSEDGADALLALRAQHATELALAS